MSASSQPARAGGALFGDSDLADPEHDVTASYALDPATAAAPTRRVASTTGREVPAYTPITGQPLAMVQQSDAADVEEAFARARRAQQEWAGTPMAERAARMLACTTWCWTGRTRSWT